MSVLLFIKQKTALLKVGHQRFYLNNLIKTVINK
jgi:hypothetical protein